MMPCTQRKARILLKDGKARIYQYNPFTIQLCYATGEAKQESHIGIDTGSRHIGIAVRSEDKVFFKAEVELRQDVKSNLDKRRLYRKDRRKRKNRYRKARFLNRRKPDKWLPPSLQNRVNHTFRWIDRISALVPNPVLHIEAGKFDTAQMIRPDIQGVDYQQGQTFNFYNVRYFVFARDHYTCQCCRKATGKILQTHHIVYRSNGGTDRADNLITVCTDCHTLQNHKEGGIFYQWQKKHKRVREYKEPPFMNSLRKRICMQYPEAVIMYGFETAQKRREVNLDKTHYNDAIIVTGITSIMENPDDWLLIRQFRKKKRSLHEATARKGRKEPNRMQKRNAKNTPNYRGFYLNDKVKVMGQIGYISSFANGCAYVKNWKDEYIRLHDKTYKQISISNLKRLYHGNNWQYIAM